MITDSDIVQQERYKGHDIIVYVDDTPVNPRDNDTLGKIVCPYKHRGIGDKWHDNPDNQRSYKCYVSFDKMSPSILRRLEEEWGPLIWWPLTLYDHGNMKLAMGQQCSKLNEDDDGIIYISKIQAREEYDVKLITKKIRQQIYECFVAELEEYNHYLNGEVYCYTVDLYGNTVDSCSGYYGDGEIAYIVQQAKQFVDNSPDLTPGMIYDQAEEGD